VLPAGRPNTILAVMNEPSSLHEQWEVAMHGGVSRTRRSREHSKVREQNRLDLAVQPL
jgi:hypothetical protein